MVGVAPRAPAGGSGGADLVVTLNGNAAPAAVAQQFDDRVLPLENWPASPSGLIVADLGIVGAISFPNTQPAGIDPGLYGNGVDER